MEIIINSNSKTSDKDMDDLRVLLEDIRERYHFSWHLNTYEKEKPLAKGHVKYGCGHETDGVLILDSNELSMVAYLEWSESVGIFGDKTKCFDCWCKEMEEQKSK